MLSAIQLYGALASGAIYGLVAFSIYLSFRVLDFPDLTVDGSFPLGAAVAAVMINQDLNPWLACLCGFLAGALAGALTAWLHVRLKIMNLLASILVMTALYSINLRVMAAPNLSIHGKETIVSGLSFSLSPYLWKVLLFGCWAVVVGLALWWFLRTQLGLAIRATGANGPMARAQGINTGLMIVLGISLANGLVGLAGALMAQSQSYSDVQMGMGTIVVGLASLIGGEAILAPRTIGRALVGCILGAIMYRLAIALALNIKGLGIKTQDFNLITALLVTLAIVISNNPLKLKGKSHD